LLVLLAALAVAGVVWPICVLVRPSRMSPDAKDLRAAVAWLRDNGLTTRPLITTNAWAPYFLGSTLAAMADPRGHPLADAGPGTILIWDAAYSPTERFNILPSDLERDPHWHPLYTGRSRPDGTTFTRIYQYAPHP
jgi:hypothetical protein